MFLRNYYYNFCSRLDLQIVHISVLKRTVYTLGPVYIFFLEMFWNVFLHLTPRKKNLKTASLLVSLLMITTKMIGKTYCFTVWKILFSVTLFWQKLRESKEFLVFSHCVWTNSNENFYFFYYFSCVAKCSGIDSVKKWCPNLKA